MGTIPADVRDYLAEHVEYCDLGWRTCRDCAAFRDNPTLSAVSIAKAERQRISTWLAEHPLVCVYCGDNATDADHLVPEPWTGRAIRRLVPTVPACRHCNRTISDAPLFTVPARAEVVATSIRSKWRRKLQIPDRDETELAEYSFRMRQTISASQAERRFIRARLIVLEMGGSPEAHDALLLAA